jgi:hypothetical protein
VAIAESSVHNRCAQGGLSGQLSCLAVSITAASASLLLTSSCFAACPRMGHFRPVRCNRRLTAVEVLQ